MSVLNALKDMNLGDAVTVISVVFIILLSVLAIFGFFLAKSRKGRLIHDKLDSYEKVAKMAFTAASKQSDLVGKEKKQFAIDFAEQELKKLGYKKLSIPILSEAIENAYATMFKTYEYAYNWGLSTNDDGSEEDAFKDENKNGVADFLEDGTPVLTTGTTTVKEGQLKEVPVSASDDAGLQPVAVSNLNVVTATANVADDNK